MEKSGQHKRLVEVWSDELKLQPGATPCHTHQRHKLLEQLVLNFYQLHVPSLQQQFKQQQGSHRAGMMRD